MAFDFAVAAVPCLRFRVGFFLFCSFSFLVVFSFNFGFGFGFGLPKACFVVFS